jgi:lysozyme
MDTKKFEGQVKNEKGRHVIYGDGDGQPLDWDAVRDAGLLNGIGTFGHGTNAESGFSDQAAEWIYEYRKGHAIADISTMFSNVSTLTSARGDALADMVYNLGLPRFMKFKKMIAAINGENWDLAAAEALDSRWAKQVKGRAVEIARILREGE